MCRARPPIRHPHRRSGFAVAAFFSWHIEIHLIMDFPVRRGWNTRRGRIQSKEKNITVTSVESSKDNRLKESATEFHRDKKMHPADEQALRSSGMPGAVVIRTSESVLGVNAGAADLRLRSSIRAG